MKVDTQTVNNNILNTIDKQNAKDRLLEAGISLFAEKGYASTSVREITARAGVTKPVLYYYFKNKEGLFRAIMDTAAELQQALLKEILETPGKTLGRFIYFYRRLYEEVLKNKDFFRMINNLIFGPPQGAPDYDIEQYHRRTVNAIKSIYMDGIVLKEVNEADPEAVAMLVVGIMDFCFHFDYIHPELMDLDRPERLLTLAFQGLARREGG
jgi:AcrR family transcriptional regulator